MNQSKSKNKNKDNTGAASARAASTAAVATPDTTGRRRILDEYAEWKQRPPLTAVETERVLLDLDPRESATSTNFPPMPDNDLVCTQFQSWVLEQVFTSFQNSTQVPTNRTVRIYIYIYIYTHTHIYTYNNRDESTLNSINTHSTIVCHFLRFSLSRYFLLCSDIRNNNNNNNKQIYEANAVGATRKDTMYQPTAPSIRLCNAVNICPEPTEEIGVLGAKDVYPAAGTTLESRGTRWADHMVLMDPTVSEEEGEDGSTPITHYRSSFSYTAYYYSNGNGDDRIEEFPVTGK